MLRTSHALVWQAFPHGSRNLSLSFYLLSWIVQIVQEFKPDVIESTDYSAPLYAYLMQKRAGLLPPEIQDIPVVIFNHGFDREIYLQNGTIPQLHVFREQAAERLVTRWADICLAPSHAARATLHRHVGSSLVANVLPEPFRFSRNATPDSRPAHFFHLGRVSISKGIDKEISLLNRLRLQMDIERISYIGGLMPVPFRHESADKYILSRLASDLRDLVVFHGHVPFGSVYPLLEGGGYSMNLSTQETFNYAFLEMVDMGLYPITLAGTAMAEFYPTGCPGVVSPTWKVGEIGPVFDQARSPLCFAELREFCRELTDYGSFAESYTRLVETRTGARRRTAPRGRTASDVSVLIAYHNDVDTIAQTLQSLADQTVRPGQVILFDDGSERAPASLIVPPEDLPLLVVRSEANEGLCATRNKLIELCSTELAVFLDSDDYVEPEFVEKTLRSYNNSEIEPNVVFALRQNFELNNEIYTNFNIDDHDIYFDNNLRMTALIETPLLREIGFDPLMRNGEADDWNFWLAFKNRDYRSVCIPEPLFKYRFRNGSMSWPWSEGQMAFTASVIGARIHEAMTPGRQPEIFEVDLMARLFRAWSSPVVVAPRLTRLAERVSHIEYIRDSSPVAASLLRFVVRLATGAAKRIEVKRSKRSAVKYDKPLK